MTVTQMQQCVSTIYRYLILLLLIDEMALTISSFYAAATETYKLLQDSPCLRQLKGLRRAPSLMIWTASNI